MSTSASRKHVAAAAALTGAVVTFTVGAPQASATPQDDLWNLFNQEHVKAGCAPYNMAPILGQTAGEIARTMLNPPGGIAGNGRVPADQMLANKGYFVKSWAEADYLNPNGGSPQDAMNFWRSQNTKGIFPNCDMHDLGTGVWIQNGKWAAVAVTATSGGTPPAPPVVH